MDLSRLEDMDWHSLHHAYGPADEVPEWIRGLRDPGRALDCLDELANAITHQSTRYPATAPSVPFLVDSALDPQVTDTIGVLNLVEFCATGYIGYHLDWRRQRDLQEEPCEKESWDAVVGEHGRLRELLRCESPSIVRETLTVLAWTGDADSLTIETIERLLRSNDDRDRCTALLASTVLGTRPDDALLAERLPPGPLARFGISVAGMRFGGHRASIEMVDVLCSLFSSDQVGYDLKACEFLLGEDPARFAEAALSMTPPHLHDHASEQLLAAIARGHIHGAVPLEAYLRLHLGDPEGKVEGIAPDSETWRALARLPRALRDWDLTYVADHDIFELKRYGLPATADELAAWLLEV